MKELREKIETYLEKTLMPNWEEYDLKGEHDKFRVIAISQASESILAIIQEATKGMVRLDENQIPPHNTEWDKKERTFEAYTAGQNDMIADGFRRVVLPDTGKEG